MAVLSSDKKLFCSNRPEQRRILKLRSVISRFHRFTLRSSVEMNVWRSELTEMELMW